MAEMTADDRRQITVRVTPRLWMLLKHTAKAEKRSVSAQAAFLIEQGVAFISQPEQVEPRG